MTTTNRATVSAGVRRAQPADATALTELALSAKAVWGYDAAFMTACRAELTIGPADLLDDPTFVIEVEGRILGFYQLRCRGDKAEITLFFVAPTAMRCGIGRRLWAHLEATARTAGATRIEVDSDPHAAGFYAAMGMRRIGEAASASSPGRMLPRLVKHIAGAFPSRHPDDSERARADAREPQVSPFR